VYDEYDDYSDQVSNDKVELPRIHAGFFFALASLVSPSLLLVIFRYGTFTVNIKPTQQSINHAYLLLLAFSILIFFWAGAIVKCISDIALFHSRGGRIGLFLLIISPFLWSFILFISVLAQIMNGLSPLMVKASGL